MSSFVEYLLESLAPLGPVQARSMFGGFGLSLDGLSFGLVDEDVLYLRTDEQTRASFQQAGSGPFTYGKKGEVRVMKTYWSLPPEAADDADALVRWARLGFESALRAEAAKQAKKRPAAKKAPAARKAPVAKKKSPAAKKKSPAARR